ncbi:MAG: NUDIX domain-containing protein, partial [Candidatus Abyssubacteria bacterium]|nr:NUDIX domain-containing protein [Candidatus Abyssubacteria bacterium]
MLAVGAVIRDSEGRIFLVKHKVERGGFWQGKWICPGGKLEPGETLAEGAVREVREETHLEIKLGRMLPAFETIFREGGKMLLHVVYIDFLAEL